MDYRDNILESFRSALKNVDRNELLSIINDIDNMNFEGVSMKEYLHTFHTHYDFLSSSATTFVEDISLGTGYLYAGGPLNINAIDPNDIWVYPADTPPEIAICQPFNINPLDERVSF